MLGLQMEWGLVISPHVLVLTSSIVIPQGEKPANAQQEKPEIIAVYNNTAM